MQPVTVKGFRLSAQQARLWSAQQKSIAYRCLCQIHIQGEIDLRKLQLAFQMLIARHTILRMRLHSIPGMDMPMQFISPQDSLSYQVINLEGLTPAHRFKSIQAYKRIAQEVPFDLQEGPLLHCTLLRETTTSAVLFLALPAICADAATLKILITELVQLYRSNTPTDTHLEEPLHYTDAIGWLEEARQEDTENQNLFWQKIDFSLLHTMTLPLADTPHIKPSSEQDTPFQPLMVDVGLTLFSQRPQLLTYLEKHRVSLEAFVLACWQTLLWRFTAQAPLLMGVECDGRIYEELTTAPGLYSQIVPISATLTENMSFTRVLTLAHSYLEEAKLQQLSFAWPALQTASATRGQFALQHFPLCFTYEEWPASIQADNIIFTLTQCSSCIGPFDLKLHALQTGQQLHLSLYFHPQRITTTQVQHLAKALDTLMAHVIEQPELAISAFPLLSVEDQRMLQHQFSVAPVSTHLQTLVQRFEAQVERHPHSTAVQCGEERLTYAQLNKQANRLAHLLRGKNVGPGILVGLYMERSLQMILGLLAVWKAGGAYVPLDPDQPITRLNKQLSSLQMPVLLTQQHLQGRLSGWHGQTLCLDDSASWEYETHENNLPCLNQADDLAYIIYTSGSTGTPKGVMIRHSSVVNYTLALNAILTPGEQTQFASVSTPAADLGNTAIFCALASGGCLHILRYETVLSGKEFADYIAQNPIDVLKIVPSHIAALLASCGDRPILPRQHLILGGEAFTYQLLRQLEQQGGSCVVLNHYGPTETTVGALVHILGKLGTDTYKHKKEDGHTTLPIGYPLVGVEAYILDQFQHMVPVGAIGELYLGGAGLSTGYWLQPEQTRERFIDLPWRTEANARLYRTGDLVRCTEDGLLEFIGRTDMQVKLRGYRIELAEIEASLGLYPGIRESVVTLREDTSGNKRLVAYVITQQSGLNKVALRSFMEEQLPPYMIPATFVFLRMLPLNPNGKIDYSRLPAPDDERDMEAPATVMPRTPTEELLLGIWKTVLHAEQMGVLDEFSALGGHSLLATQIISRVRQAFQVDVPLRNLFEHPTVAGLSTCINQLQRQGEGFTIPPLLPIPRTFELPTSFAQQRLWFLHQLEPENTAYILLRAQRFLGVLRTAELERSLHTIIKRHEVLRTTFHEHTGMPIQIVHPITSFHLPVIDLSGIVSEQQHSATARQLADTEAQQTFNLSHGPLMHTWLLKLGEQEHILMISMDHIITDGWSNDIFVYELTTLYQAFTSNLPSPLRPLPIQYADFAHWQRQWLRDDVLNTQLAYWKQQLADAPTLDLPTDYPRPPVQMFRGALAVAYLPEILQPPLIALAQSEGVTLFMLFLSAFYVLMARYTGQDDLIVGTAVANRTQPELEGLIGFFINTLVLRCNLSGNPSFTELLKRVREMALGAYTHQDTPFEQLVEILKLQRDLSRPPLVQVLFGTQQEMNDQSVQVNNTTISRLGAAHSSTKFDLTFNMRISAHGLRCSIEYSTDLFEAATIERLLTHWQILLTGIVAHPQAPLASLPLLSPQELTQLSPTWKPVAPFSSLLDLLSQQAQLRPDALALADEQAQLSYAALAHLVSSLALRLQAQGVHPEQVVAVWAQRGLSLQILILAVLAAGGVYLPLDPSWPLARLQQVLQQSAPVLLLTTQDLPFGLLDLPVVSLSSLWSQLPFPALNAPTGIVHPDQLAYLLFTSGSTGLPKGVAVAHRGLSLLAQAQAERFAVHPQSHVLQFAAPSFDAALAELFASLQAGARLEIASRDQVRDLQVLLALLAQRAITVMTIPPSLLAQLPLEELSSLHSLIVAGEACSPAIWQRGTASTWRFTNAYGPTEATVCATSISWEPGSSEFPGRSRVPIGQPLPHVHLLVLDAWMQPVPRGVVGELFIGGEGVARGYLNQPDLTAHAFRPDPWSQQPGARLYQTGDRVCWTADGQVEFVGRRDEQVKVRGYRIELGEIEALLQGQEQVRECVVVLRPAQEMGQEGRVIGYVVTTPEATCQEADLKASLSQYVPEYMVPARIIIVPDLPRTSSGKVDRHALPDPELTGWIEEEQQQQARTPLEALLVEIWSEVLEMEQVGIHENFFELGGHSLLITRVLMRVQEILQKDMPTSLMFNAPTIAEMAELISEKPAEPMDEVNALVPREHSHGAPLSFEQQRLWFLDQLLPGSCIYLIPGAQRIQGHLYSRALEQSIGALIKRHESLRTHFEDHDGEPIQVIRAHGNYSLPLIDLQELPHQEREKEIQRMVREERKQPFNLAQGPLLRTGLLQIQPEDHVLLITMHHIISDGWSHEIFLQELRTLYRAYSTNKQAQLSPLPIQYADYALWQREHLHEDTLKTQLAYWQQQLAGINPLELSTDYPRPPVQSYHGNRRSIHMPPDCYEALQLLSQQEGVTIFMLLLAAFQVLLYRYTDQPDISIGTPVANRARSELEGLIGFFVNTLVMRINLAHNPTFAELLKRVRTTALEAYAHQDIPFEHLVEALQPQRDLSRSPLFQVMFVMQHATTTDDRNEVLRISHLSAEHSTAKFDLSLSVVVGEHGLHCSMEYCTDLFTSATIEGMLEHWQILLQGILANPQCPLSDLPLLSQTERSLLLHEWNATRTDASWQGATSLIQRLDAQALLTPDAIALLAEEGQLSYQMLHHDAHRLAHLLLACGVGPEVPVALLLDRSLAFSRCLLAILKAQGIYFPLDPTLPPARLGTMMRVAQPPVLLTSAHFSPLAHEVLAALPDPASCRLLVLEDLLLPASWLADPLPEPVEADLGAYLLFTSGSTGVPKGVLTAQRAIGNRLGWMHRQFHLGPGDRVLQKTPSSFDVSVWELLWPLGAGATLVLARVGGQRDSAYLRDCIQHEAITLLHFVPSLLQVWVEEEAIEACSSVRDLICSGEALSVPLARRLAQRVPTSRLWNLYGPTEAAIDVSCWPCLPVPQESGAVLPIGRPIANIQLYVLDAHRQPVPIGVAGELWIGGIGLARGYLGQPEVTALSFQPHPFSEQGGERLYRTGDRACWRADGTLEYLGRLDGQVKLRGNRIELGEIESVVGAHAGIEQCAVVLHPELGGGPGLVAHLVHAAQPPPVTEEELRRVVREALPDYMVPGVWQWWEQFPLSQSGKLDRRALMQAPLQRATQLPVAAEWPLTEHEHIVRQIWGEVLGREEIGLDEDFFAVGGHSLLATRVLSRLKKAVPVSLELRTLFEAPTIRRLAECIEQELQGTPGHLRPALIPQARGESAPLSFAQQRLWFLDQLEPQNTAYLLPGVWQLQGKLDLASLEQSMTALLQRHESLRTVFRLLNDQPVQIIQHVNVAHFPVIDLQNLSIERRISEAKQLAEQEKRQPCHLSQGPLFRITLLHLEGKEHILLLTMHHIISDGWSLQVLMQDLVTLYRAASNEQHTALAPLPIQYADYALWQRQWLRGEVLEEHLLYWKQQLAGFVPLRLPLDHPRSLTSSYRGTAHRFVLPDTLSQRLMALCHQEGVTPFMLLLSAFQILLQNYCQQDTVVVGTDVTNRDQIELEGLIGFFINQMALRADLINNPPFRVFLQQIKRTALEAYAHQDLPFEQLVEALRPDHQFQAAPLFPVKFLLDMLPSAASRVHEVENTSSVTVQPLPLFPQTVQLDLILRMTQTPTGLAGTFTYRTDLFEATTIVRMAQQFTTLLESICNDPDSKLHTLEMHNPEEKEKQRMQQKKHDAAIFAKFKAVNPRPISLHQEKLIETDYLGNNQSLPLVIRPAINGLDLVEWTKNNRSFLDTELLKHGAILLRGFHPIMPTDFERFVMTLSSDLLSENGEHVPAKDAGGENLYTPVFYAPEKKLLWHNENSFNYTWPGKIWFFCAKTADEGGATPIVDSRQVFQRIDPKIRERFLQKGIMYVRNYGEGLGLTWQTVFHTNEKAEVEAYCQQEMIEFSWQANNCLKTQQVRPAVLQHPQTREWIWWNQAMHWHPACLDEDIRTSLLALFAEEDLPRNCYYGDGSPIEASIIEAIYQAYQEAEVSFPWQVGDILMLDNMLTAHARNPYQGTRKIYVTMGDMHSMREL